MEHIVIRRRCNKLTEFITQLGDSYKVQGWLTQTISSTIGDVVINSARVIFCTENRPL